MFYTIYKTTNLINNKIYIGVHRTENLGDTYLGSGIAINNAIKKYSVENFKKEILFIFDNEDEMFAKEFELVNEDFINSNLTYNMIIGGYHGPSFKGKSHTNDTKLKISFSKKGKSLSDETIKKIVEANQFKRDNNIPFFPNRKKREVKPKKEYIKKPFGEKIKRGPVSEETKKKISETTRKRLLLNPMSEETKKKISNARKQLYLNSLTAM